MENIKALVAICEDVLNCSCKNHDICDICAGQAYPNKEKFTSLVEGAKAELLEIQKVRS